MSVTCYLKLQYLKEYLKHANERILDVNLKNCHIEDLIQVLLHQNGHMQVT